MDVSLLFSIKEFHAVLGALSALDEVRPDVFGDAFAAVDNVVSQEEFKQYLEEYPEETPFQAARKELGHD